MDFKERAKKCLFDFDFDFESEAKIEKINQKYQLRKKHNQNKIMEIRKKRIFLLNQNKNNNNEVKLEEKTLLDISDITVNIPLLNKISQENVKLILEYLNSDNFENIKWVIYSLRIYFEKSEPKLDEYLILFKYKIHLYFENLLKKYANTIYIINEILFIIANFFSFDEIINKYPENYFSFFLNDYYISFYQKCFELGEEELIVSVFLTLENILLGKNSLIKKIFKEKEFIQSILGIINEREMNLDLLINFIKFFQIIMNGIKDDYIQDKSLFYSIFTRVYFIYKLCDKINLDIIKGIFIIIINAFDCKYQDKNSDENNLMMNYLFEDEILDENQSIDILFVHYIFSSLYNNPNFYLINDEMLYISLVFLELITDNCYFFEINEIITCQAYKFFEILNNYFKYNIEINILNNQKVSNLIIQLLKISNNIIDSGLIFAQKLVITEFFQNLIIYFRNNLSNKNIVEKFLDTFYRLLGHEDKIIADNLFKRGILYDGIFCQLLINCNNYDCCFNEEMILKMIKIISRYFIIVFDTKQENKFSREDMVFGSIFKEFITNTNIISEGNKECIFNLEYMKLLK